MVFKKLNIPLSPSKTIGPVTSLEYLGIILDTDAFEARIPVDKINRMCNLIHQLSRKKRCTKRELLQLIGHFNFATRIIIPGRSFLSYLFHVSCSVDELHYHVRLGKEARIDLSMWEEFLTRWNGRSLFLESSLITNVDLCLFTDAAGSYGYDGIFGSKWFSGNWDDDFIRLAHHKRNITLLELMPIVISAVLWGANWSRRRIIFYCDNQALVYILNKRSSFNFIKKLTRRYWLLSLAPSTRRSYATGLRIFQQFLFFSNIKRRLHQCFDEQTIQYFISYCIGVLHIRSSSIRSYLAAIRYYCLRIGRTDPLRHSNGTWKFSVNTLLKTAEKFNSRSQRHRLPICSKLLSRICHKLNGSFFDIYWDSLLRASLCCAFYGFLRPGEFTVNKFNASRNLTLSDMHINRNSATFHLKRSKTDRCNYGVYIRYYRTNNCLCPISHLHTYIKHRSKLFGHLSSNSSPMFIMPTGRALTRTEFVKRLREVISSFGINSSFYSGHSLRIGAASTAAKAGLPIYLIKILGRWSSEAYRRYISVSSSTISNAFLLMSKI
ncbi:unnamed protein product [Rotaria socialis]|uniref:Tyr recombinase domain-containing protein n=1 Tax=Rotaria socialis TaxID=392032 RepID=A0A817XIF4_9BILA|nr:unnamed protein product [Rotaria socialis]